MNLSAFLANWRTTVWGGLCILAGFITQQPQVLDAIVEPAIAKKIAAWAFLITGLVTFAASKDAAVSGNGSVDDPARKQAAGRSQILPLLLLAGLSLSLTACAAHGWNAPRLSFGVTGGSGTHYAASYDGKTVALDLRLPPELSLRK